jgi:hypothetical protein
MKEQEKFDYTLKDSQSTLVEPVQVGKFPVEEYQEYEELLNKRCRRFWREEDEGVLVYRRMRVADVFSAGCKDMKQSLEWQLGALQKSMDFKADVPNFLEPWYGLGTSAAAFGFDYLWNPGQAPAVDGKFKSTRDAFNYSVVPVSETAIGKHTLNMIEFFMEQTGRKIPISFCDIQSPLNVAGNIIDINGFMMDFLLDPEPVVGLLNTISDLIIDFTTKQEKLIGEPLVFPGHGFASSRKFDGFGMSDDNIVMISNDLYENLVIPSFEKTGMPYGGPVLHSCGKFHTKIESIKKIAKLKMVDAAFSAETDPDPNVPEPFSEGFASSGIILNARIVGGLKTIEREVKSLWRPGLKMIVVTYCTSPEEQAEAYELIHNICKT